MEPRRHVAVVAAALAVAGVAWGVTAVAWRDDSAPFGESETAVEVRPAERSRDGAATPVPGSDVDPPASCPTPSPLVEGQRVACIVIVTPRPPRREFDDRGRKPGRQSAVPDEETLRQQERESLLRIRPTGLPVEPAPSP